MQNVVRALVFDKQVSLTLIDGTQMVAEGIRRHKLARVSAEIFGKALCAMTFASACLKMEKGEISLSAQTAVCGDVGISGNQKLFMRGYIQNTALGEETSERSAFSGGALTIIRDDGYNRPFVGSCAIPENGGVDGAFEEYYRISEQLPTRIKTAVVFGENGALEFAGAIVLQPLPFADKKTLEKTENVDLEVLLNVVQTAGIESALERLEGGRYATSAHTARYQCNCSRERLLGVLASVGEKELRKIIEEDGAVQVHCHYCNTDYTFTNEDADALFAKE